MIDRKRIVLPGTGVAIVSPFTPPPLRATPVHCDLCGVDTFAEIIGGHSRRHVRLASREMRRSARQFEYRVRWRRAGGRWQERRYATAKAAQQMEVRMRDEDDLHWMCDESHRHCFEPITEGPVLQRREVSSWHGHAICGWVD